MRKIVRPMFKDEFDNLEQNKKEMIEKVAPFYFKAWEKKIEKEGGKYAFGDEFTLADVFLGVKIVNLYSQLPALKEVLENEAPKIFALSKNLMENDLKTFYDKSFIKNAPF